jgi:hypothetical protein
MSYATVPKSEVGLIKRVCYLVNRGYGNEARFDTDLAPDLQAMRETYVGTLPNS